MRSRRWDIPQIAVRYLNRTDIQADWELDGDAVEMLTSPKLDCPGNIRELESVMERSRNRARAAGSESKIRRSHLDLDAQGATLSQSSRDGRKATSSASDTGEASVREKWSRLAEHQAQVDAFEKETIEEALAACNGTIAQAARLLELPRTGLISRIAKLEIDPERFKNPGP